MAAGTAIPANPSPHAAQLAAALARAAAERLVAYPTETPGLWSCKGYHIQVTGPRPVDVECDCADATFRGRICKHAVCVVFARKHRIRPSRPALRLVVDQVVDRRCAACAEPLAEGEFCTRAHACVRCGDATRNVPGLCDGCKAALPRRRPERWCMGCGLTPVADGFHHCPDCASRLAEQRARVPAFDPEYDLPPSLLEARRHLR